MSRQADDVRGRILSVPPNCKKLLAIGTLRLRSVPIAAVALSRMCPGVHARRLLSARGCLILTGTQSTLSAQKPMKTQSSLAHAGRWLLNRRDFLRFGGTGLGGIALTALLAEQGLLAADKSPIRPQWSPERPAAPRPPHFAAKAKNVLVIFCSGALSHLDVWDYKPELNKRHGQPLPGSEKLVTFQGANGALTQLLWEFKPRGQSGKMISNMLPHLAELADDLCFIHSMTANSNTHGPAENQRSTGFTPDGF